MSKIFNNKTYTEVLLNNQNFQLEMPNPSYLKDPELPITMIFKSNKEEMKYLGFWYIKDCKGYVYYQKNPNRELDHKNYVILKVSYDYLEDKNRYIICGYDKEDIKTYLKQKGYACNHCKTIIWSSHRHDYHSCRCEDQNKSYSIDGGFDYFRGLFGKDSDGFYVDINLETKEVVPTERS